MTDTTDSTGIGLTTNTTSTEYHGFKITTNTACKLITVTKDANCTATTATLANSSKVSLATASFSGNNATFSYDLTSGTTYYIVANSGGSSYTRRYKGSSYPGDFPVNRTNVNFIEPCYGTTLATMFVPGESANLVSVTTQTSDGTDTTSMFLMF